MDGREGREWLPTVAAAYRARAQERNERGVTVHRVEGGANNALYRVEAAGHSYACKMCVPDERRRAAREHGALLLLAQAGPDVAPRPILLDESCTVLPFPSVVYRWLEGTPLGPVLVEEQMAALLQTFLAIHSLDRRQFPDSDLPAACLHWFEVAPYLEELEDLLKRYGPWLEANDRQGPALHGRLARLVGSCGAALSASTVPVGHGHFPLRLCRGDPNLANAIGCADGRLRWVDWEYSGWGDPALDLANLRWHGATSVLSPAQQEWLWQNYRRPADDPGFEARLALWDRLLATRWPFLVLRMYWCCFHGPDRLRLSLPAADPEELRARMARFIERAERLSQGAAQCPRVGFGVPSAAVHPFQAGGNYGESTT